MKPESRTDVLAAGDFTGAAWRVVPDVTTTGEFATAIERGVILGLPWPPPGVPDTAQTRAQRDQIAASIAAMPPGVIPDIPAD